MHDVKPLHLDHYHEGDVTVVTVAGEVDVLTAPQLRELLLALIDAGRMCLVVNVEQVGFLDSTGLGVLIGAWQRVRGHGGTLAVAGAPEEIRQIFHVTCLTRNFGLYETTGDAMKACRAGRVGTRI